ncbi:transient receptor potential cation channel subfamily M member-like 2 [Ruditapes philippinarum]|uniref:transient receptor potential cation channel subfamily M member-like 2 n=1 Tax=Ruditapes philippinarum TaxID=129788 RepID=UPI00295C2C0E|nr:transient receptor potential cation channel subfamily M member-like 2 [Ruditapes philippinarum]
MADSRVFPGTSDMDVGYSTADYRGAAISSVSNVEMESQRNRMTLEEARWIGVRKKVPGMSGIPKKAKSVGRSQSGSVFYVEEEDPYQQKIKEIRVFVRNHFRQKECASFVPKPGQTTGPKAKKKIRDLQCHCGEVLMEHAGMQGPFPHFSSADMMLEYLVPKELQKLMSRERRQDPPPEKLPAVTWKKDIRTTASCAFGKINFENVEHSGGKKPAKYIRMTDEDSVDNLIELMKEHWKIMEPERPNLVISVVGGAKNFKLDGRMRDTFSTGLIKAAKTTSAWLISSGFNMGVMKAVGQAVRQGQSFCWDNDRMVHVLRCIGIAPWGYVKNRRVLESVDGQGKFNADFRTSNVILHDSAVPLNPDHTHFIFVDDGYRIRYGGVAGIRAKLEQKISQPQAEGGLGIPVVLVVVEGGTDCINDARTSIEHKIPVVVCAGTGRAADIIAYAYTHTKTSSGGIRSMKEKHELKLMDKIFDAYGKNWKDEEIQKKTIDIKESVQICCQNSDLLTVFHMNKHEDLDLSILSVLLKAKKGADEEQRLSQLKLALTWDRVDIAQEEIFREDVLWSTGSLDDILTEALLTNKVKFVLLILQQGVVMKEYLTVQVLERLYKDVPKHNFLYKLLHRLTGKEDLSLENVCILLKRLLDRYDTFDETLEDVDAEKDIVKDRKLRRFKRPYKMLLVWALLMKRQTLAKLFWELGEEPVTSALAATRIYHAMAKNLPRHESHLKESFYECENEFEKLATEVLNECHHKDPDKAMMIAERKSPCWNEMTSFQIAAAATDQVFLSSVTCFSSLNVIWKHGILFSWLKMIFAMFFPPYIAFGLEILSLGENKLTWIQKMGIFYSSPMAKFAYGMVMYIVFLVLHSYMVLVDFKPDHVTPLEIIMIIWVFSFFIDDVHTFIAFPSPTTKSKIRDWYGFLKWLDLANFILAFTAFIVHHFKDHYQVTKVFYCINSIIFFLRIMKIYVTNGQLGPKIFMIQRMLDELRMFVMVLFVFLLAYGVASQGLLYDIRTPSWAILKDIVYFPYWQLYGEIFLEEIDAGDTCVAGSADCKTGHWLIKFLLAAYLLVGNILLLNLLIAIFSHVFDKVEKNSNEIWKYQMYFLVMEYEKKTALVPPLSLFQHVFLIASWIVKKTCQRKVRTGQNFGRRHLEYLQLFEKEMMMNYLRQLKAEEMSGIEMTVNKLQKRVDELTKLIEDEVIADQQPNISSYETMGTSTIKSNLASSKKEDISKLEPVEEEDEETTKKKKKKHKKEKKRKQKEGEEIDRETKDNQNKGDNYEKKLSNIVLPQNIQGEVVDKPEPAEKLFHKTERGLRPVLSIQDDSGTDNMPSPYPSRRGTSGSLDVKPVMTHISNVSMQWSPRRNLSVRDLSDDENEVKSHKGLRKRMTQERMQRYISSDSENDLEGESGGRFSSKLKKQKKKKKRSRQDSDTE